MIYGNRFNIYVYSQTCDKTKHKYVEFQEQESYRKPNFNTMKVTASTHSEEKVTFNYITEGNPCFIRSVAEVNVCNSGVWWVYDEGKSYCVPYMKHFNQSC